MWRAFNRGSNDNTLRMLSSDDHPGLFTFMVGLIIVVFVGVGLSMMVDRKFSFSKRFSALESGFKAGEVELEQLKLVQQEVAANLADLEPARRAGAATREAFRREISELGSRRVSLIASRDGLGKSISALKKEFSQYAAKYREVSRTAAVGQSLGNLTVRGGREYRQAVISRVTDVGLEIRHEHGIARIQAPDLDQAMQDRFQWNDEERRARLNEEDAAREEVARVPEAAEPPEIRPSSPARPLRNVENPDAGKLDVMRGKVMAWKTKVAQLSADRSRALASSSYGSQSSVPGSLETWQARASRLGMELAKARAELAAAKAALSLIAPDDSLLRPDPERP